MLLILNKRKVIYYEKSKRVFIPTANCGCVGITIKKVYTMITLSNINEFTNQQIFEQCAKHLIKQGEQSLSTHEGCKHCKYREGDLKCAVGCFIPDEDYSPYMEGKDIYVMRDYFYPHIDEDRLNLLGRLQSIHDEVPTNLYVVPKWKNLLLYLAKDYGLDASLIDPLATKKVTL